MSDARVHWVEVTMRRLLAAVLVLGCAPGGGGGGGDPGCVDQPDGAFCCTAACPAGTTAQQSETYIGATECIVVASGRTVRASGVVNGVGVVWTGDRSGYCEARGWTYSGIADDPDDPSALVCYDPWSGFGVECCSHEATGAVWPCGVPYE